MKWSQRCLGIRYIFEGVVTTSCLSMLVTDVNQLGQEHPYILRGPVAGCNHIDW